MSRSILEKMTRMEVVGIIKINEKIDQALLWDHP